MMFDKPWYVYCSLVALAFAVITLARAITNRFPGKHPPIFEEIPFIGGLLGFIKSPIELGKRGHQAVGEVFTVPLLHLRMTFFVGPSVSTHFYNARDELMSQQEVYGYSVPTFGNDVVFAVDDKVRAEQFQMLANALKSSKMASYVPTFVKEARTFFGEWGSTGVMDFKETFNTLILYTASATIMGKEVRENVFAEVTHLYDQLDQGMQPISVIAPYLPTSLHRKRDAARQKIGEIFRHIINKRRASGVKGNDILQTFIDGRYERAYGGRQLTESEITGLLIAALFAGMHTSTITSAWTGLFLSSHRKSWDACVNEQRQIMEEHGDDMSVEVLGKMEVLHACITEALRMYPPLIMMLRYAKQPFTVKDSKGKEFYIPKGDICVTSPSVQHRVSNLFENPEEYDHTRFLPPRSEDKIAKFTFIGFGGGRHGCMGTNFAYLQIKSVWSYLIRNFEFQLLDPVPSPDYSCLVVGPKACRVKFVRRPLA